MLKKKRRKNIKEIKADVPVSVTDGQKGSSCPQGCHRAPVWHLTDYQINATALQH